MSPNQAGVTQAWKSLVWVVCILLVSAACARLLSTTPVTPGPPAAPPTPRAVGGAAEKEALRDIGAGYAQIEAAIGAKDIGRYMTVLAPGYTRIHREDEVYDRLQWGRKMAQSLWTVKSIELHFRVVAASAQSPSLVVLREESEQTYTGVRRQDQLPGSTNWTGEGLEQICTERLCTLEGSGIVEATWSLTAEGWKLSSQKLLFLGWDVVRSTPAPR